MTKFRCKFPNMKIMVQSTVLQVVNGIPVRTPGKFIQFEKGEYVTKDKKEIAFLRKHKDFGVNIFEDAQPENPPNPEDGLPKE